MTSTPVRLAREELVGKRFLFVPVAAEGPPYGGAAEGTGRSGPPEPPAKSPPISSTRRGDDGHEKKLKLSRIADWNWISGQIRCASTVDENDSELQVRHAFILHFIMTGGPPLLFL